MGSSVDVAVGAADGTCVGVGVSLGDTIEVAVADVALDICADWCVFSASLNAFNDSAGESGAPQAEIRKNHIPIMAMVVAVAVVLFGLDTQTPGAQSKSKFNH